MCKKLYAPTQNKRMGDLQSVQTEVGRLTDEILNTVMVCAENIVSGSPITKLNDETAGGVPLTANHLMLMHIDLAAYSILLI